MFILAVCVILFTRLINENTRLFVTILARTNNIKDKPNKIHEAS